MSDTYDGRMLSFLIVAQPGINAVDVVGEVYQRALEDNYDGSADPQLMAGMVLNLWQGCSSVQPLRFAWRVGTVVAPFSEVPIEHEGPFLRQVVAEVLALPRDTESGILSVVKLSDPVQLHDHTSLYRRLYLIEMSLREAVSYIFACAFPDDLVNALDRTTAKPANPSGLPPDQQLISQGENRFFYILFDKYAVLNDPPDVKVGHISSAIKSAKDFDDLRERLDLRPIKQERHAGFLASLQTLMDPLEKVRNAVAHNREVPKNARENFDKAAETLRAEIGAFWQREAEHAPKVNGNGTDPTQ